MRLVKQALALFVILFLGGIVAFGCYFTLLLRQAKEQMGSLEDRIRETMMPASEIVSGDGKVLYTIAEENRIPVKFSEIPKYVRDAIVAAEDKRFYSHQGYDLIGISRAIFSAVRDKRVSQGGSTLEMQLAKRLYTGSQKTMGRKFQDVAIATTMEKELSKDQILLLYLNQVYFGEGAHGIGAAARIFFNKRVQDLTLAEAAILSRCVRRPRVDNPLAGQTKEQEALNLPSDRAMNNKEIVLGVMRQEGMITQDEFEKAVKARPKLNPNPPQTGASILRAPYFVDHVLATLKRDMPDIDLKGGGYRIETTLDTRLQAVTESEVRRVVRESRRVGVTTGAFMTMDGEGRILSEVGGVDYRQNQLNAVFQGTGRQPGSTFKPFVYAAALSSGALGMDQLVSNEKIRHWVAGSKSWYTPRNDDERSARFITMNEAIRRSVNRAAVNTCATTGVDTVIGFARDTFGIPAKRFAGMGPSSYSVALGTASVYPIDMARAYSVFMLGGDRVEPHPINRVIGPDGEVVRQYEAVRFNHVLDPTIVAKIDDALRDVVEAGTGTLARIVPNARGKTGTTQDGRDLWFCGYTDGLVGVGWMASEHKIGNSWVYRPMNRGFGGKVTIKAWAAIMQYAYNRFGQKPARPSDEAPIPDDVKGLGTQQEQPAKPLDSDPQPVDETPPDVLQPDNADIPPAVPDDQPQDVPPVRNRPRPRDTAPRDTEMVEVQICADSGMKASMYCPETVAKLYPKGKEPRKVCTLHKGGGF